MSASVSSKSKGKSKPSPQTQPQPSPPAAAAEAASSNEAKKETRVEGNLEALKGAIASGRKAEAAREKKTEKKNKPWQRPDRDPRANEAGIRTSVEQVPTDLPSAYPQPRTKKQREQSRKLDAAMETNPIEMPPQGRGPLMESNDRIQRMKEQIYMSRNSDAVEKDAEVEGETMRMRQYLYATQQENAKLRMYIVGAIGVLLLAAGARYAYQAWSESKKAALARAAQSASQAASSSQ